jgi:pSer/pThr/pTyr-binding forkhead associated (FHA) protein
VPKLVVNDRERTWLVDLRPGESLVVGRSSSCELWIDSPRASRRHCEIRADGDRHRIVDLGSTNGTTLGGAPFSDAVVLKDGDRVDAAGCLIVYWSRP